jgi:cell wall-associated NlpC family hydrolase
VTQVLDIDVSDLIGKPYALDGAGPYMYGCWQLVREVSKRAGVDLPNYPVPSATSMRNKLFELARDSGNFIQARCHPGAIVTFLFCDNNHKKQWHVGLVLDEQCFIHVTESTGVCICQLTDPFWSLFIQEYYDFTG